jgi:hypothetical protein
MTCCGIICRCLLATNRFGENFMKILLADGYSLPCGNMRNKQIDEAAAALNGASHG